MNYLKNFIILFFALSSVHCTVNMNPAQVPTNPPKVPKSTFKITDIAGAYTQSSSPNMFLWPTHKQDGTALTFSEQAGVRQQIVAYREDKDLFTTQADKLEDKVRPQFELKLKVLENNYTNQKCYSFCDPDGFDYCDPEDASVLMIDEWLITEDKQILSEIAHCQENQKQRKEIKTAWKEEIENQTSELRDKAAEAALRLLETVGDDNYFTDLTEFGFIFDLTKENCVENCSSSIVKNLTIHMEYGNIVYSNKKAEGDMLLSDLNLDRQEGYLSFKAPGVDLENDNKVYGEIFFDLEFVRDGNLLKVEGDIRVFDNRTQKERVGRFASSGRFQ